MARIIPNQPELEKMTKSTYVMGAIIILLGTGGVLMMVLKPNINPLWTIFFYSIPSNCSLTVFPHEPVLLLYGITINAWYLSTAAIMGTLVAAYLDYRFFSTVLNTKATASRYREKSFYRKTRKWFYRAPFLSLVVAGATPLPFFPFKLMVCANKYPLGRFLLATALGRFPRYMGYALLGQWLKIPTWMVVAGFSLILVIMYSRKALDWIGRRLWPDRRALDISEKSEVVLEED